MRFSTTFAVLTASAMAFAGAVPWIAVKRSGARVACYDFIAKVDIIIPEFGSCSDDTCSVTIVDQLINVIDACTTALGTLPDGSRSGNGTLADSAADTVAKIANSLKTHKTSCGSGCPNLAATYTKVDSSLSAVLLATFRVFNGLKYLVSSRLASVLSTLQSLAMTLTLVALS